MNPIYKSPVSPCDMSTDQDYRPIKRIRQACQNCRRKKARCTGERPECSFCVRLGQHCSYSDDDSPPASNNTFNGVHKKSSSVRFQDADKETLSHRIIELEQQMGDMVQTVKSLENTIQSSIGQLTRTLASGGYGAPATAPGHVVPKLENGGMDNNNYGYTNNNYNSNMPSSSLPYSRLPPSDKIRAAADLYFRYCHNQPYSLFHEAGLRHRIDCGEVPTHLLFALLASTVRYSSDPFFSSDKHAAVQSYANQSWRAITMPWNGIQSDAELSTVQTILLLAIIDYTDGRTQASWIKVGLAIRLAQDFRLMVEPDKTHLTPIQQEERRRVFWSFYLCDKLISCGRERPAALADDHCHLQLPMDENSWRLGHSSSSSISSSPGGGSSLSSSSTPTLEQLAEDNSGSALAGLSPFATTIVVASLLGRCAQYALGEQEEQTPGGRLLPWNPRSKYSAIHSAIMQHESELGLNEPLSEKMASQCVLPDGSLDQHRAAPLALAHALFYLCQCLLYHPFLLTQRLSLVTQRTPQSFLAQTQNSCRAAASSLSRLMDDVKSLCCETMTTSYDPFYGYCNMVAGVIHAMFLSGSRDPLVRKAAEDGFESSLENLKVLGIYWKSCDMMRARLEDFRKGVEEEEDSESGSESEGEGGEEEEEGVRGKGGRGGNREGKEGGSGLVDGSEGGDNGSGSVMGGGDNNSNNKKNKKNSKRKKGGGGGGGGRRGKYAALVDPTMPSNVQLSQTDANDLLECLDYARMSTTPRRKSQSIGAGGYGFNGSSGLIGGAVSGGGAGTNALGTGINGMAAGGGWGGHGNGNGGGGMGGGDVVNLSQLPSPFFEELVNLLPLSYSRPVSVGPLDNVFDPTAHTPGQQQTQAAAQSMATGFDGNMTAADMVPDGSGGGMY